MARIFAISIEIFFSLPIPEKLIYKKSIDFKNSVDKFLIYNFNALATILA